MMKATAKNHGQQLRFVIAVLILLLPALATAEGARVAPDWMLVSAQGETVRLSETVKEQPVVLLFWASWCPYCKALMPHLHSLRLEHGDDIVILAINFREDGDPVEFVRNAGYDFTVLPDGDDVAAEYDIYGTPGLLIVDKAQNIRFDLRALPRREPPFSEESSSHKSVAAYRAPYWAAEIRKSIDEVLGDDAQ
jgi:cytochrome c biogenesis protein CcmG/thiol:disulfide interchange protein DsbE